MKKIEKYIIAVITLIAIGAIGTAIYFGVNKTNEVNNNNNKENSVETNDNQEKENEDTKNNKVETIDVFSNDIIINDENLIKKLQTNEAMIIDEANK